MPRQEAIIIYYPMLIDHQNIQRQCLRKLGLCLFATFTALFPVSVKADAEAVFNLINERLSFMEDVALYKKENRIPVEDVEREQVVIANAAQAAEIQGIEGDSISAFFAAQIEVAKAIQYRSLANWISEPTSERAPDLVTDIRPALTELGNQIVTALANNLRSQNPIQVQHRELFQRSINITNVSNTDKDLLFDSLLQIRMQ